MTRWLQNFRDFQRDVMAESRLTETIQRLVVDGELTPVTARRLTKTLQETKHESQYIVKHLCAHLAIGLIFSFDLVPLPLGTLTRGAWVAGNRLLAMMRGRPEQSKVHSLPVLAVSLIPFAGYFAYLIPLRAANADAAYLYANHVSYLRSNCSLRQYILSKPPWQQRLIQSTLATVLTHSPSASETT
ncbi:MAG: hypothetical protein U0872_04245 [Planctomycetaceae bacterium]